MAVFLRTAGFLLRAQSRTVLFGIMFVVTLGCAVLPLLTGPSIAGAAVICDEDGSDKSRALVAAIDGKSTLQLRQVGSDQLPSELERLRNGVVEAVFVINNGYGKRLAAGEYENLVSLYLSPYSTVSKSFSDCMAAAALSQWLGEAVGLRVSAALDADAGKLAAQLFAAGCGETILTLQVQGEPTPAIPANQPDRRAKNALWALAIFSCFIVLCLPAAGGQDRGALLDRFSARGWSAASLIFAQPAVYVAMVTVMALIPCILLSVSIGFAVAALSWLLFLLCLLAWLGTSAALDRLLRTVPARLAAAAVIAILNMMLSYPAGLAFGLGPARALFSGYWFSSALWQGTNLLPFIALTALASFACLMGVWLCKIRNDKIFV